MDEISNEPESSLPAIRHDGWTGEAMAKFLETLADTGIVMEACDAALKSTTAAYALRRREPLFAQAWEKALCVARDRLADILLARSIEGNVERIVKDGEVVAEKHFVDNRLGLAILKRLDQRTEAGRRRLSPFRSRAEPDWDVALTALRTGEEGEISNALALFGGNEVGEVCDPPCDDGDDGEAFAHERIWRDWESEEWCTNFPPPAGFTGYEEGDWEDDDYFRELDAEEMAALAAAGIDEPWPGALSIEEDEAERQAFFDGLAATGVEANEG